MDLVIGKLSFLNHPLFNREEIFAGQLRKLIKLYKSKTDLAVIPHLRHSIEMLKLELNDLENRYERPVKEIDILLHSISKKETQLQREIETYRQLMNMIYDKWKEIKREREKNNFVSSPVRLNVS